MADEAVALLERLVSIPSVTGDTGEAVEFLRDWCSARGMEAVVDRGALVVNPGAEGPLLLGHVDTVPGEVPVRLAGGELWGRGAVDAKGPLCAALFALHRLASGGSPPNATLVAVPDEEGDSATAYRLRDEMEQRPTIVLEPSGWEGITTAYRGRLLVDMDVRAPPSHSGYDAPFSTERAIALWESFEEGRRPRILRASGCADRTTLRLDFRYPAGERPDIPENTGGSTFTVLEDVPPYTSDKNSPLVRAFMRGIRSAGGTPAFKRKTGTADMNVLGERWSAPIVAYGPGDGRLDHTDEERIAVDGYLKGVEVLTGVLGEIGR